MEWKRSGATADEQAGRYIIIIHYIFLLYYQYPYIIIIILIAGGQRSHSVDRMISPGPNDNLLSPVR